MERRRGDRGDVVFYGTMDGWFKAVDAKSGDELWKFKTGSGIIGQPTIFRGPDGKEYVAILSGVGGWAGAIVPAMLDPRDGTAALGFVNAMKDLPQVTSRGGTLYVFALPVAAPCSSPPWRWRPAAHSPKGSIPRVSTARAQLGHR